MRKILSLLLAVSMLASMPMAAFAEEAVPGADAPGSALVETLAPTEAAVPETTVPETTVPETTVPETTVPETTVPETTVPETTVPETTVPETTVPETTAAAEAEKVKAPAAEKAADGSFPDVKPGIYCYDSVNWAVENGITNGQSDGSFGIEKGCIRRHVVMFLWRAMGKPEPASTYNPFVDVKHNSFEKPILWAYHEGITTGKDATHFNPDGKCTRKQIVTFLWRAKNKPEPKTMASFPDVKNDRFAKPIIWAAENGVTGGYKDGTFRPENTCTRGQIVTFLYRAKDIPAVPKSDPVTIRMWFHGSSVTPEASAKVMAELNKILTKKINVVLEPIWGTWGDFDTSVTTSLAAGDDVDIYFTSNWSGDEYNQYARDGYWVKLDNLLPKYAPELLRTVPKGIWECAETNGYDGRGIYAVPGLKDTAAQNCWDVNATLLKELGFAVPEKLDYYSSEFEAMLRAAKEAKGPDFYPLVIEPTVLERMANHSSIVTGDVYPGNVLSYYYDADHPSRDTGAVILGKYATPEFKRFVEKTYEYSQKGYIAPANQNITTAYDYRGAVQCTGEYLIGTQSYFFGCERDFSRSRNIEVVMIPASAPYMDCTSAQGAMMAISAVSKHPEKALQFLNLLNTDSEVMTLVNYGVEGFTYEKNSNGTIRFNDENRENYSPWANGVGNIRILPPTEWQGVNFWKDFSAYYDSAEVLPYGSFILDTSGLENEAAALSNLYFKYAFNLMTGAVDPDVELPKLLSELEDAGIDRFVREAQKQMAAFK